MKRPPFGFQYPPVFVDGAWESVTIQGKVVRNARLEDFEEADATPAKNIDIRQHVAEAQAQQQAANRLAAAEREREEFAKRHPRVRIFLENARFEPRANWWLVELQHEDGQIGYLHASTLEALYQIFVDQDAFRRAAIGSSCKPVIRTLLG